MTDEMFVLEIMHLAVYDILSATKRLPQPMAVGFAVLQSAASALPLLPPALSSLDSMATCRKPASPTMSCLPSIGVFCAVVLAANQNLVHIWRRPTVARVGTLNPALCAAGAGVDPGLSAGGGAVLQRGRLRAPGGRFALNTTLRPSDPSTCVLEMRQRAPEGPCRRCTSVWTMSCLLVRGVTARLHHIFEHPEQHLLGACACRLAAVMAHATRHCTTRIRSCCAPSPWCTSSAGRRRTSGRWSR